MHKYITATNGKLIRVDGEYFEILNRFNWNISPEGYARTTIQTKSIFMHRLVLGQQPDGAYIADHKNKIKVDNTYNNLRWATKKGNSANTKPRGPHGYKGVRKIRNGKKYRSYITIDGKQRYLGLHETAEEAAKAYDEAAKNAFGDFAGLNFPEYK